MDDANTIRKLRAIMFSDIVGYSKMMQTNESEALKLLQKHKDIVTEISAKYGGKIIKHIGDEILVESESAVMLVYCAKELQKYFADRNTTVPKSRELWVRIGIHIGDVIVKEDDIFGDGVNIASRIRPLAKPGGIVITHSVLILLGNQDDIRCEFIGGKRLKNIKEKVKVYEVLSDSQEAPSLGRVTRRRMDMNTLLRVIIPIFATVLFCLLMIFLIFFNHFSDFEENYFRSEFGSVREITKDLQSDKNIKSNYYNIMSSGSKDRSEIMKYYSDMFAKDPENPKKALYMGLAYLKFHTDRNQLDSAYILFRKASGSGLNSLYLGLYEIDLYKYLNIRLACRSSAENLLANHPENPLALIKCADVFSFLKESGKAGTIYRKALDLFPESVEAMNGLAMIEYQKFNFDKAKSISDSALAINPVAKSSIETALLIRKNLSDYSGAREILSGLPDDTAQKYSENAIINLMEGDPSSALMQITNGLGAFPNRTEFLKLQKDIQNIIVISDSIQKKENSVSRIKNRSYDSWNDAVQASLKEQRPLVIAALDDEQLQSKYLELALLDRDILRTSGDIVLLKVYKHKDKALTKSLGISRFPALLWVNSDKETIKSFINTTGNITDPEIVKSFITESVLLNKRMVSMIKETEANKVKNARNFSHAEELALEYEMPIMVVLSDKNSVGSETYMKHTIMNPGFIKNYRDMIFLSIDDAKTSEIASKYKITRFPSVLFFDEDINLISVKYGTMPQKVLEKEINKVKLFRKRRDVLKEEINWIYDPREAESYSVSNGKPVLAYYSRSGASVFEPEENFFKNYSVINKINSSYIPLFIRKESEKNNGAFPDQDNYNNILAVMNSYGELLYDTEIPEDIQELSIFLDYKTNSDLYLSLGYCGYKELQKDYETVKALLNSKLKISSENELLSFITKYPSFSYAYVDLGRYFLDYNDFSKSAHYLKFLQEREFDISDRFLQVMVSSFMLYDDYFRLNEFLNMTKKKFSSNSVSLSSIYAALAEMNLAESGTLEALSYADSAYTADPKRTDNFTLLGILNYNINKPEAEKYFKKALIHDPEDLVANSYLFKITGNKSFSIAARRSYHTGNSDFSGLRYFDNTKYFTNKGLIELKERSYRIRLSLFPDNQQFMLELARFITDTGGSLVEALEITNKLLSQSPNDPDFLSAAAWVFYNLGDFSGADKLITKALVNLSPDEFHNYPELFYNIGMIKSAIGDNRTAAYYFETLLGFRNKNDIDYNKIIYAERFIDSIH